MIPIYICEDNIVELATMKKNYYKFTVYRGL